MRSILAKSAVIAGTAALVVGCSSRPDSEITAANAALARAHANNARMLASESMEAAQASYDALAAELGTQDGKWIKSYDHARELANETRAAADKAAAEAQVARADREWAEAGRAKTTRRAAVASAATDATADAVRTAPVKIHDVRPVYPAIAQSARVDGTVVIEATIDAEGKVAETRVVRSVPLLDQAALDAVRQWEYKPSMKAGQPVASTVTVRVNFVRS